VVDEKMMMGGSRKVTVLLELAQKQSATRRVHRWFRFGFDIVGLISPDRATEKYYVFQPLPPPVSEIFGSINQGMHALQQRIDHRLKLQASLIQPLHIIYYLITQYERAVLSQSVHHGRMGSNSGGFRLDILESDGRIIEPCCQETSSPN
jgi:hypothetical protein